MTKHMVLRSLTFLALTSIIGCTGDPTSDLSNGPDRLLANPSTLYVGNGAVASVIVTSVDQQGNQVADNFRLADADVGPGISVELDTTYSRVRNENGVLVPDPNATRVRYLVTTDIYTESEFTVRAGNRSITIPVRTQPVSLTTVPSDLTPALGDTVTITAPEGLSFSPTASTVTFANGATHLVSRTEDEIKFVPGPGYSGPASVTNVSLDYEPGPTFTVPTADDFAVPAFPPLTASIEGSQPIGATVTVTIPAPFKWNPSTAAATRSAPLIGAAQTSTPVVSADSQSATFQVGPQAAGDSISLTNLQIRGATTIGPYILKTNSTITTPSIATPGSFAVTTAQTGDTVTLTLTDARVKFRRPGGGINFLVSQVATPAIVVEIAPDSNSIKVLPPPLSAGPATLTGLRNPDIPSVSLNLTATNQLTYGATPLQSRYHPGRGDPSTAPAIGFPTAVGDSIQFYDSFNPNLLDQFYLFNVPATPGTWAFTVDWEGGADVDVLRCSSTSPNCASPSFPAATANHPETATITLGNSAANTGAQRLWINLYSGATPRWIRVKIRRAT